MNPRLMTVVLLAALVGATAVGPRATRADPTEASSPMAAPPDGSPPSPELVEKGRPLYSQACAVCHGLNGRGGPGGAADLTASGIATANDAGLRLGAFLTVGRPERGMPAHPVTADEAAALSAQLRAFGFAAASSQADSGPASVLVGDAAAGKAFFNGPVGRCSSCHAIETGAASSAANLSGVAARYPNPKTLQNAMLLPERRFYWSPANSKEVSAIVTFKDGHSVRGYLSSVSDFKVILRADDGSETTIARDNGDPKVVLVDRLQHHLDLMRVYHDNEIHDLTAYLATLK